MDALLLIAAGVLVLLGAHAYWRAGQDASGRTKRGYFADEFVNMPSELRKSKLLASERDGRAVLDGRRIVVRPDQVYQTEWRTLVVVETKTRLRLITYDYDIIELSLQRLSWQQKGRQVEPYGYVRLVHRFGAAKPQYRKVDLLSEQDLVRLVHRYEGIVSGDIKPAQQTSAKACQGCSHRKVCKVSAA